MNDVTESQADQARKFFVANYKKIKKVYLECLSNFMLLTKNDESSSLLIRLITVIDAPANLWDNSSDVERISLWLTMIDCLNRQSENLIKESEKLSDKADDLTAIDPNDTSLDDEDDDSDVAVDDDSVNCDDGSWTPQDSIADADFDQLIPDKIYHASPRTNLQKIQTSGLESRSRQFVHMHGDRKKAINVASRHGNVDVVLFEINTNDLSPFTSIEKYNFGYGSVYLAKFVPPECIEIVDQSAD